MVPYRPENIKTKFPKVAYFNIIFRNSVKDLMRQSEIVNTTHYAETADEIQGISEKSVYRRKLYSHHSVLSFSVVEIINWYPYAPYIDNLLTIYCSSAICSRATE